MKNKFVPFRIRVPRQIKKAVEKQALKEGCSPDETACKALDLFLKVNMHKKQSVKKPDLDSTT